MSDWTDDETISDTDCVDARGFVWPEHDYPDDHDLCRRCGAEAGDLPDDAGAASGPDYDGMGKGNWEDDAGAVSGELVFKGLATFVLSFLLYLTYWTAANMLIMEFFVLAFFDIFIFLSWSRAYARSQIRVYGTRPPVVDEDPGEI